MTPDHAVPDRWMAGGRAAGVGFALYDPVVITVGPLAGSVGAIALVSLNPAPVYTVEIGVGQAHVHVSESDLAEA